jgi:hypothetical protein
MKILDVDNDKIYKCKKKSSTNSLYLRLSKKVKYVDLYMMNDAHFKILLDLSFLCSLEYTDFELRFYRIVDLKVIYI